MFFKSRRSRPKSDIGTIRTPRIPDGRTVYAIGDIHGCATLLDRLLDTICQDAAARGAASFDIIFLGDLIDRGPESAQVIDRCIDLAIGGATPRFLIGNHEEMMLKALDGSLEALRFWMKNGGVEAMASYGVPDHMLAARGDDILADFATRIPARHLRFLRKLENSIAIGDYLFVHAGVRPGIELERQSAADLRWIRDSFLDHEGDHGAMIVHGHTITDTVEMRSNRIGVDTGAYKSGVLSAICLSGTDRWIIQTSE